MSAGKLDDHVTKRHDQFIAAHNAADFPNGVLDFIDENCEYIDHASGPEPITKEAFRKMMEHVRDIVDDFSCKSVSVHGDREFTATEWRAEFRYVKQSPMIPPEVEAKGQRVTMHGCSFMHWNENDKIVKNTDYSKFIFHEA